MFFQVVSGNSLSLQLIFNSFYNAWNVPCALQVIPHDAWSDSLALHFIFTACPYRLTHFATVVLWMSLAIHSLRTLWCKSCFCFYYVSCDALALRVFVSRLSLVIPLLCKYLFTVPQADHCSRSICFNLLFFKMSQACHSFRTCFVISFCNAWSDSLTLHVFFSSTDSLTLPMFFCDCLRRVIQSAIYFI